MRKLLPLLLLLIASVSSAQHPGTSGPPVLLKQLPPEGVVLDKGWKFQVGDNRAYADPAYDDSTWQTIDPAKDIHEVPQLWTGVGWFRIKFKLDSTVTAQPLVLLIQQSGASEVYINGKLLHRYGNLSSQAKRVVAFNPLDKPLPLQFTRPGENLLAVRYSLQPSALYTQIAGRQNPALRVSINNTEAAIDSYARQSVERYGYIMLWIGIYFLLIILHLAFYVYYPAQKANLYFTLFALSGLFCYLIENNTYHQATFIFYQFNLAFDFSQLGNFFLLTALYFLLNQRRGWIFWSLGVLTLLGLVLNAVIYDIGFYISSFIVNTLVNLETVRIAFKGVKSKQRGAWIIATGAVGFFVFWCFFMYVITSGTWNTRIGSVYTIGDLTWAIAFLSIPIATSVFLALDFAFTSRSLQQKLAEVNELSQRSLAQEREKQQILATQKETLEQQVTERTAQLKQSLEELKATQAQLVQREKMASLGELTAGIAHEIQNPLNFVNNFSETNLELLSEMHQELDVGAIQDAKLIAKDVIENERKINHHGRRAEAIVKGMLQHSRASTGDKELTDINTLVDEYLRLSYHGVRAKDKEFSSELEMQFDPAVGKVNIVPQEIGRVLLNLFNNAFYATAEKKKRLNGAYEPLVTVTTKRTTGAVEIQVTDNGTGILKATQQKIFQPFFTTKPTGEGTGLGLSLSYDIITKGHGGELTVQSVEGEGAAFVVRLPA